MVVMAAIFIRNQPTFTELLGDNQNSGKFISIFFLIIQIAFQSLSSFASLVVLKGSARMDGFCNDGFAVKKVTFYKVILQFV